MNKKLVSVISILGIGITFCIIGFRGEGRKKKTEPKEQEESEKEKEAEPEIEPDSGKSLVRLIMIDLLKKPGEWKNERDYLEKLTKEFIRRAKNLDWLLAVPVSQDELWTTLKEEKLVGTFELELEKKYKRQK